MIRERPTRSKPAAAPRVLLVHGLWLGAWALRPLQARLADAGFSARAFSFHTREERPRAVAARLRQHAGAAAGPVHVVGHSLGGLVALLAFADEAGADPGARIVCLGSPLAGSAAARSLDRHHGGWMLGKSREALRGGIGVWRGARAVGMVAGTRPVGLGRVLAPQARAGDGTVAVAETRVPGLADHCSMPVSHSGLLFSAAVAAQVAHFLRHARFSAGARRQQC